MGPAAALLAVGLVALGVALTAKLRQRRQAAPRDVVKVTVHDHYCSGCDREWFHPGQTCLQHWSWACEDCRPRLAGPLSIRRTA